MKKILIILSIFLIIIFVKPIINNKKEIITNTKDTTLLYFETLSDKNIDIPSVNIIPHAYNKRTAMVIVSPNKDFSFTYDNGNKILYDIFTYPYENNFIHFILFDKPTKLNELSIKDIQQHNESILPNILNKNTLYFNKISNYFYIGNTSERSENSVNYSIHLYEFNKSSFKLINKQNTLEISQEDWDSVVPIPFENFMINIFI